MKEFRVDTKNAVKEMNALIDKFKQFKKSVDGTGEAGKASFKKLETSINGLKKATSSLMAEYVKLDKAFRNVSKSQKSFVTQTRNLKAQLKDTKTQLQAVNLQLDKLKTKTKSGFFAGMLTGAKKLIAAFGILSGVMLFSRAIQHAFQLTKQLDSMAFAMKAVITEAIELAQTEIWLKQITKDFGAELITTTNRYIKFRAAANQAGLTAKETQDIFGTMTKAAGVLGLKTDELTGVYLALEQMISKGKITTEELRRQLGERLPGAMDIMANSLNVTTAELDDMMKKGLLITKDVLPGFAKQVEIAFGLKKIRRVDTLQAATVRLRNAWTILVEDFKKGNDASQKLTEIFDTLADNLANMIKLGYRLIQMWVLYRLALQYTAVNTKLLIVLNKALSLSFWKLTASLVAQKVATIAANVASWTFIGTLRTLYAVILAHPLGILVAIVGVLMLTLRDTRDDVLKLATALNKQSKEVTANAQTNYELSASLKVLLERYKELNAILVKSGEEQKELATVIEDIGKSLPGAVKDVDEFGRAISISEEATESLVEDLTEMNKRIAKIEYEKQVNNLNNMNKAMANFEDGNGVVIDGLGNITLGADGVVKKFETVISQGGAMKKTYTELDDAQTVTFLRWKTNMKSQITDSEKMVEKLLDIALAYDPLNMRLKLMREEMERIKDVLGVEPEAKTVAYYKNLIKEQEKILQNEVLIRAEAIPHQEEILRLQAKIDEILGKKIKKGSKRVSQLKIIKDLLNEIQNIQLKQQVMRFDVVSGDEDINFDERENALYDSALVQIGIERNIKDAKQQLNLQQFEKDKLKIEEELKLREVSVMRRMALQEQLVALKNELRQKDTIAEELFANKIYTINNNLRKKLEGLSKNRRESLFASLNDDSNLRIIALNDAYEEERQISTNRITIAKEVYDASKKSSGDLRKLRRAEAAEYAIQAKAFKKLEKEKAEVVNEAARIMIQAKIHQAEGDLLGLDVDEDAAKIKKLTELINELKASLKQLEAPVEITIDLELMKIADVIGHVKEVVSEIGNIFDAFADARIERIEAEIERERDRYDALIDLAKDDLNEKEALEGERDDKIKLLEAKRLKEEQKQAKLRKAFALADIAQSTAMAIMRIWASSFDPTGISQGLLTAIVATLGAAQIATVLATPIPQYAEGGKIDEAHKGVINDAGVQEYIVRNGDILTTTKKDAIVNLKPGDEIHSDFSSLTKDAILANAFLGGSQMDEKSFNYFFKGISRSLEDGLSKAKFVNNIKLNNKTKNDNYGNSLSKWSE